MAQTTTSSPATAPVPALPRDGVFDWTLFALLFAILIAVAASNVWLRLRAEKRSLRELLDQWRIGGRRSSR